jgi:hypothetical protein
MNGKQRYTKSPETNESRREDLLARWVSKAKSELPIAQDEMDAWMARLEACLKVPSAKSTA